MKRPCTHEKQIPGQLNSCSWAAMTRRFFLKQLGAAGLIAIPLLAACSVSDGSSDGSKVQQAAPKSAAKRPAFPPIDVAVPVHTRTATFAMG